MSQKLPPKKKVGRKPILDAELVAAALVETDGNVHAVARKFGVDRSAVRQLIDKRPNLRAILTDCREGMKDRVESQFYKDCLKDSPQFVTARIYYLKTQARDRGWEERKDAADTAVVDAFLAGLDRAARAGEKPQGGEG